ncbi:D-lactate dehydrogenase [cytochrome], mitochondrial [Aspergillus udagawae]|uniref:D-lactate dehydrogenase (cytochrome) n=1 Tax=Aspergillus udagawae TaxID=91492 RepID=A0ABQ1B9N8_9EURO|nr:D-lactate dehydrogenase [cytochrome], mitochondrial [Aspergillus udagawae]GFF96846.1 D-lactate dehydrogenase [cytochrome], mitochondrial [Aspergillus udagawae]GFG06990.1 D-lactate dehydrogenase [cytochrome], mitochondrial [Aspergillus udagawae]
MSAIRSHLLSRGFPAYPRALLRQTKTHQLQVSSVGATRYNSSNSSEVTSKSQRNFTRSNFPAQAAPSFWTSGKALLACVLAASIGYAYAATSRPSRLESSKKPRYGTAKDFEKAIAELRITLGDDAISTDEDELQQHGYSEWSSVNADRLPVAVAYPTCTEDVVKIAKVCHKYRMPMVPYSGGSSLEANFSAPYGGLTIDFAMMNEILEIHEDDMDIVVQPSIQWMELNEKIKDTGLFFPVDPGPSAMIGGMIGTNCSGTNAVRYGTMKDWVINLTVVLADGRVMKTRRRPRKTSAGYNLTGMFVGSEGTLGIVTEATLKLAPIPEQTRVGVVAFPTIRDAASTAMQLIRKGIPVQCMEILDDVQMDVINRAGGTGRAWKTLPTLFFKFSGTKAGVSDSINLTRELAKSHNAASFEFARDDREAHDLWSARKQSLWSMMSLRKEGSEVWSTDVAVPISRLPDIIEISKKELDNLGLFASILGHIGDGNFHSSIMYDRKDADQMERVEKVVHDMVDRALEMEGSCTGEHGVGLGKKASLKKELGPATLDVMRSIKKALDPHWLLNPGKIFDYESEAST